MSPWGRDKIMTEIIVSLQTENYVYYTAYGVNAPYTRCRQTRKPLELQLHK